jgi:hypothetical protein
VRIGAELLELERDRPRGRGSEQVVAGVGLVVEELH